MQFRSPKGYTVTGQLGFLLLFTGLGFIVAGLVQMLMLMPLLPKGGLPETQQIEAILKDPAHVNLIRWMQVISTFFLFCLPALLFSLLCNGKKIFWLGFNKHLNIFQILLGFLIMFLANLSAGLFQEMTEKLLTWYPKWNAMAKLMEDTYNNQVQAITQFNNPLEFAISLIIMAFLPAMFEELFFRGALQQVLVKRFRMPIIGIILTSLIFSLVHASITLFLSRFLLGMVLGLIFSYTRNIWVNIIAHFLNNAIALIQLFYLQQTNQHVEVSKMDMQLGTWISMVAMFGVFGLFILLKKHSETNKLRIYAQEQALLVNEPTGFPIA